MDFPGYVGLGRTLLRYVGTFLGIMLGTSYPPSGCGRKGVEVGLLELLYGYIIMIWYSDIYVSIYEFDKRLYDYIIMVWYGYTYISIY